MLNCKLMKKTKKNILNSVKQLLFVLMVFSAVLNGLAVFAQSGKVNSGKINHRHSRPVSPSGLAGSVLTQVDLPVTFDITTVNYDLVDFGGNASSIVADPVLPTNKVGKTIKTNTAVSWAGTTVGGSTGGFANPVPFAPGATKMTMRVYSPDIGTPIRMKVEDPLDGTKSVETEVTTTVANAWQTLEFDFSNPASGTPALNYTYNYKKLSVFFNFGTTGAVAGAKTYYWDDVIFEGGTGPGTVNVNFQVYSPDSIPVFVFGSWGNWGNWPGDQMTSAGTGYFATTLHLAPNTNYEYLYVNGYPYVKEVLNPAWPCTNGNATYTNRVLNLGAKDTTICFTWASCTTCQAPVLVQVDLPVNFDATNVNYDLVDFGGNVSLIAVDPVVPANKVAKSTKTNTAETWAGTTVGGSTGGFATAIPFAVGYTKMTMRVFSPDAGIPVRMKVEDPLDPTKSVETEKLTTVANAWETLEFDFSNQATGTAAINFSYTYKKLSVFFNFGTTGATAGNKTYYWDDIHFVGSTASVNSRGANNAKVSLSRDGLRVSTVSFNEIDKTEIFDAMGREVFHSDNILKANTLVPVGINNSGLFIVRLTVGGKCTTYKALLID